MKISDGTKIQSIDLRVKDTDSSMKFYSDLIGFKEISRDSDTVYLSANGEEPYLISLNEVTSAAPRHRGSKGLFHTAIRLPNRKELARKFIYIKIQ